MSILKKARQEFIKVFPHESPQEFGLYTGTQKNKSKICFCNYSIFSRNDNYKNFKRRIRLYSFDEAHRTDAKTYQIIFNYFNPDFMLGMTATPEEQMMEIYSNYLIIILHMKFDYLKPWKAKYFAHFIIMELPIIHNGIESDDFTDLKDLTSEERVSHIVEKANYYGFQVIH